MTDKSLFLYGENSLEFSNNPVICNDYVRGLAIYDHLNECLIIANKIKEKKNSIDTGEISDSLKCLEDHYRKELADLYILLESELDSDIVSERKLKFIEKAKKDVR